MNIARIAPFAPLPAALLLIAACGAGPREARPAAEPAAGGQVSDFALKNVDGKTHALSDDLGSKVILVTFWATWCEPCKKEMSHLQALYDAHAVEGLMILSVSMDEPETQGEVRSYVKQRGFSYPVLLDTESKATQQLNPRRAAPYSLIIGRDRKIAWSHEGFVPGDEIKLEQAIVKTLRGETP
ncbi:MAG: TlpA disulfide reductase family protein [Deltaproteobacteria bacterium]|nr:TlpA disulfide reductase family protein [Deltaproteobacteria bacterium]